MANTEETSGRFETASTEINDAGEELQFNRRNRIDRLTWADLSKMSEVERMRMTRKSDIWPRPNYEQLIKNGANPLKARLLKFVYDAISTGPTKSDDASLKIYADVVNRIRNRFDLYLKNEGKFIGSDEEIKKAAHAAKVKKDGYILLSSTPTDVRQHMLEIAFPDADAEPQAARRENLIIGGKLAQKIRGLNSRDTKKILKELEDGWPEKKTAWERQGFSIREISAADVEIYWQHEDKDGKQKDPTVILRLSEDGYRIPEFIRGLIKISDGCTKENALGMALKALGIEEPGASVYFPYSSTGKNRGRLKQETFPTEEEAVEYLEGVARKKSTAWKPDALDLQDVQRRGPDWLNGEQVSPDNLLAMAGLRGVNFGNWVPDGERAKHTTMAAQALMDLSCVIGIPISQMGFGELCNQEGAKPLGIAIGAQGSGSAAAHFVPGLNEINITRNSGAGSLAHEMAHAIDHMMALACGTTRLGDGFLTNAGPANEKSPPLFKACQKVVAAMKFRAATQSEIQASIDSDVARSRKRVAGWARSVFRDVAMALPAREDKTRQEIIESVEEELAPILEEIQSLKIRSKGDFYQSHIMDHGPRRKRAIISAATIALSDGIKNILQRDGGKKLQISEAIEQIDLGVHAMDQLARKQQGTTPENWPKIKTDYYKESEIADKGKAKPYYSTSHEMFARALNDWVRARLEDIGIENTYLCSNRYESNRIAKESGATDSNPYLSPEESGPVFAALDQLAEILAPALVPSMRDDRQWRLTPKESDTDSGESDATSQVERPRG